MGEHHGVLAGMRRAATAAMAMLATATAVAADNPPKASPPPATSGPSPEATTPAASPTSPRDAGNKTAAEPSRLTPNRRIKPTGAPGTKLVRPARPGDASAIPGLETADLAIRPSGLLPEGAFIVQRRGTLVHAPSGEAVIAFHAGADGRRDRPMVLLPSQMLDRIERAVADRGAQASLLISGQVTSYGGVNYLLPTAYAFAQTPATPRPAAPRPETPAASKADMPRTGARGEKPAAEGATPRDAAPDLTPADDIDPSVDDLIASLEAQRERTRVLDPGAAAELTTPRGELVPEGELLVRRRARLARDASGQAVLVFDSDTAGSAKADPPLWVHPCRLLERLEAWAAVHGDAVSFTVSGAVYVHQGRNHLMPSAFTVNQPDELSPGAAAR